MNLKGEKIMKYIFVDFEMHPICKEYLEEKQSCPYEIIEFGAVMLDEQYNIKKDFRRYVNPQYVKEIYKNIEDLTKITNAKLIGAKNFAQVLEEFLLWCDGDTEDFIVYAWSNCDLEQITKEIKLKHIQQDRRSYQLLENWVDFQKEYCELVKAEKVLSLEKALELVGQDFIGDRHDALYDAKNTAELFIITRDTDKFFKLLRPIEEVINRTKEETSSFTFTLGDIFNFETCKLVFS